MWKIGEWPAKSQGGRNAIFEDVAGNVESFRSNVQQMFIKGDAIDIDACFATSSGERKAQKIKSIEALKQYLDDLRNFRSNSSDPVQCFTRFFLVRQSHSRGQMQISEDAMKLILSRLGVFSGFTHILSKFKLQTREAFGGGISCNGIYAMNWKDPLGNSVFEAAYILKHVEKNGREVRDPTVGPWSIRQLAIYQHYNAARKSSDCCLIQTSARVRLRISGMIKDGSIAELSKHWTHLHEVYLGTLSANWEEYFLYIGSRASSMNDEYLFTSVEARTKRVTFSSLQELSVLRDHLAMIGHALEFNLEVLNQLSQEAQRRATIEGDKLTDRYSQFQANLRTCVVEHTFLKQQAHHAGQNADRLAVHLRDTIALQDSNVMMTLNHRTIQEAQTVRTITLIALIFLPASFTATFLAMGYIHVESLSGGMKINVAPEIWFYLAITVPLMIVTFFVWWMWELWLRRRSIVRMRTSKEDRIEKGDKNV